MEKDKKEDNNMSEYQVFTNSVGKEASRIIQLEALRAISEIVMQTAGPKGSTTMIMQNGGYPLYSKDGKKVLEHVKLFGEIEKGILDQLIQITENVVSRVGDGTTSAIRLSYLIFKGLVEFEKKNGSSMNTYDIIDKFKSVVKDISEVILKRAQDFTAENAYDICMISTNGDEELSRIIADIYKKYGKDVYIDLKSSNTSDYMIKEYDGLTLNKGFASPAYINRTGEICELRNVRIYVFRDPIDTPEMIGFFTRIVYDNVLTPFANLRKIAELQNDPRKVAGMSKEMLEDLESNSDMIPTLIMCPYMSRDLTSVLESLETVLYSFDRDDNMRVQKPPIAIVNNLSKYTDELADISMLCGCMPIGKYIDETVQAADIEAGKAPTIDTVTEFYGFAEEVTIDKEKTRFINAADMFEKDENDEVVKDENGNRIYSNIYNSLVSFLKNQLEESKRLKDSAVELNRLKRRLSGLTAGLVELYIGGISVTDRESAKDLADDAVRNCRSASINGVGRAANFEGYKAAEDVANKYYESDNEELLFANIIKHAYCNVIKELYSTCVPADEFEAVWAKSCELNRPINLRTMAFEHDVLTSIDTDVAILDCISRVVTIMFTSNQILIGEPFNNNYASITEVKE